MILTRDQLASLNFGFISGMNLLQFCPDQLLIKAYADSQYTFQLGVNEAIADITSRLSSIYDMREVFSNSNQILKNQSGSISVSIAASTYVGQIFFNQNISGFPQVTIPGVLDIDTTVSVGTTSGGTDLLNAQSIGGEGFLWFINQYFANATTLYITISGPAVDIQVIANIQPSSSPTPSQQFINNLTKDDYLMKIVSILAIENILGSAAATNKQLQGLFERNEMAIQKIEAKQRSLALPASPQPVAGVPETVCSKFKTLG